MRDRDMGCNGVAVGARLYLVQRARWERVAFMWGTISPLIGAAVVLVGVHASVGLAVGMGGNWSLLACLFVVEGHGLVVESDESVWSGN